MARSDSSTERSFFDIYPDEYDDLTNASARKKPHAREVRAMVDRFHPTNVLDAGCATGLTSRLFAAHSIRTVGIDRNKAMLQEAKGKSHFNNELLSFVAGDFEALPDGFNGRFDLIVCLANAISGVGTMANLRKALRNFHGALMPGGNLVVQMLNYGAIREGEIMPVRATRKGKITYQRFSERRSKRLYLYVTRLDLGKEPPKFEIFRHEMDNFTADQVTAVLKKTGFTAIRKYSSLFLDMPFEDDSRDLVLTARRPKK